MINRLIGYFFFFDLIIALALCTYWVSNNITPHPIELGTSFASFIRQCSLDLNNFKIEIPKLEPISYINNTQDTYIENPSVWDVITALISQIDVLSKIFNAVIFLTNGLFVLLNFVITFINIFIQTLEFIFIIIGNFFNMIKYLSENQPAYPSIA